MAIDRIGKGSIPPVGPKEPTSVDRAAPSAGTGGAEKTFEVRPERTAPAPAAGSVQAAAPTPLERLRAGEIDVDGYVELKVDQATAHLQGLRPQQIEEIRATLREQVAADPALSDLVERATGRAPTPRE